MAKRNYKVGDLLVATSESFVPEAQGKLVEVFDAAQNGDVKVRWLYDGDESEWYPPKDFRKHKGKHPAEARNTANPASDYFSLMEAKDELGLE